MVLALIDGSKTWGGRHCIVGSGYRKGSEAGGVGKGGHPCRMVCVISIE